MKNGNASIRILGTITGLVVTVFLIAGGWFAMKTFTRASDEVPREVIVAEITSNSAKITWSTGQESQGVVEYGTSPTSLNFFAPESEKKLQHTVDLTLLSPNTTYYFQIRVGDTKYDNGGVPWTFTTKLTDSDNGSTQ